MLLPLGRQRLCSHPEDYSRRALPATVLPQCAGRVRTFLPRTTVRERLSDTCEYYAMNKLISQVFGHECGRDGDEVPYSNTERLGVVCADLNREARGNRWLKLPRV